MDIQNNLTHVRRFVIVPACPGCLVPLDIFMAYKFGMGFFGGTILVQGVLFEAIGIFLGF